ncbi:SDR family NAD(P)-dependent oxidoreductase [Alkalihalobacillus trypoxylicola]|uniref:Oxidoreductase n=1 Tax=Alkalihalobacillus trypoxylicola TaxID=519424 RepID=A0A162EA99_9BACI|nr:SDR family oxidoreductase [Alkalihalobacillus trypoxylicola]KYG32145.1 oxidoreductase [Alkalihalobacillus trypoxylicola]
MPSKIVVVTGAASGIGLKIAEFFAENGYTVCALDYQKSELAKQVNILQNEGLHVKGYVCDVSKEREVIQTIEQIIKEEHTIDVLINNAGISTFQSIEELTYEEWNRVIQTNLSSMFLCTREVLKVMKKNGRGSIVNISSTRAFMSEPESEAYAASKGGVIAFTHALAASLQKYQITINSISPGWIHTGTEDVREMDHKQHFSNRVGRPSDIASACLFLTDEENRFINGENLIIDGGMTKKMIYEH